MKIFFIILFFIDTLVLAFLSFLFLYLLDSRVGNFSLTATVIALSLSIAILVYVLYHYMKLPPGKRHR